MMVVRGIRGAITADGNTAEAITMATKRLLLKMVQENELVTEDIASAFFTTTPDLNATFPAAAAREIGWTSVPLMCAREIDVPEKIPFAIRVLIHVNTTKKQDEIKHCYIEGAATLRPDLFFKK